MTIHPPPDQPHTPRGDDMTETTSALRLFRQEIIAEHDGYRAMAEKFRPGAHDKDTPKDRAQAYMSSLMAAEFSYGLLAALRLVETRYGADAAGDLAVAVEAAMDGGWHGSDLLLSADGAA